MRVASPRYLLARLLSLVGFTASLSAGTTAMTLDEATASEFFRWFHLEYVGTQADGDGGAARVFRPQGAKFRTLAAVELSLDDRDRVSRMKLVLERSFISDPRDSSFARDMAKSFLLFAAAPDDRPVLSAVVDEIRFRGLRGTLLMRSEPPPLPSEPSPAYRAFAGELSDARIVLAGTILVFRNREHAGRGELVISARPTRF
jgi:hypothetical protein